MVSEDCSFRCDGRVNFLIEIRGISLDVDSPVSNSYQDDVNIAISAPICALSGLLNDDRVFENESFLLLFDQVEMVV